MASVVPDHETLVTGFVGDEDGDFLPFEIYVYKGETKVSVNGGMFTRIVPADSIDPFKRTVLNHNRVWEILPEISGPWRTTMPTLPNRAAFYAPPIEAPFKPRDPAIHGPMLAVRLRNLTRRIQRTRLARDRARARARARARGRTSPNTQRTLKPLLRIPDTGTSLSNSNGTSKSKSKSKSRSRKRHEY